MIFIIEPHADDAYLSMHAHIIQAIKSGKQVTIATVFADEHRARESQAYATDVEAKYLWFGYREGDALPPNSFTAPSDALVIGPLGIQHPDHIAVRSFLDSCTRLHCAYYLDIPYYAKQKNDQELNSKWGKLRVGSVTIPHASKGNFSFHFKSQAKFFYYNRPESFIKTPEIVLL